MSAEGARVKGESTLSVKMESMRGGAPLSLGGGLGAAPEKIWNL